VSQQVLHSTDSRPVICQVLHSLDMGGAEMLAAGLARDLADRYRFVFACLDHEVGMLGEEFSGQGIPIRVLHRRPGIDWKCAFRLAAFLREQRVQLVHAHQYTPFFQALLARLAYRRPPIVFTEHGRHYPDTRSSRRVAFNRALLRGDDRLIAVGESVRNALVLNEGLPEERTETIYNGVPLQRFLSVRSDESLRSEVRKELGVFSDDYVVVQVARLNELKDHATALRTARRLRDAGVPVRLVLAGEGPERPRLERLVAEIGLTSNVQFLGTRSDIPRLLAGADALLLSSVSEGIPLTLIEAMAAGVPVVSTDVGGVAEIVEHGISGLLTDSGDDVGLARALDELWREPEKAGNLADCGTRRAVERYSLESMHQAYVGVYDEMLGMKERKEAIHNAGPEGRDGGHCITKEAWPGLRPQSKQ